MAASETGGGPPAGSTTAVTATGSTTPRTLANRFADTLSPLDFGAAGNGVTNDSAAWTAAFAAATSGKVVDGAGKSYSLTTAITVPAGVTVRNASFVAGTAGMNVLLVSTGSSLLGVKVTGTGTVSTVERGIYPATDGASDVTLDVEVTNLTVGVHAQPLTSVTPLRWKGRIYVHEIVGTTGASEGYGLLLSPAESCVFDVRAKNIKRHAVYLSAGASFNDITMDVDTVGNAAAQIYSTTAQPTSKQNTIRGKVRNLFVPTGQTAGQVAGAYLLEDVAQNTITLDVDCTAGSTYGTGTAGAEFAIVVEGSGSAGQAMPTGNLIIGGTYRGACSGENVLKDLNGDSTYIAGNVFRASATNAVLALRRTGTPTLSMGPIAVDNQIDALGANIKGIYDEVTAVVTIVDRNDVQNNGSGIDFDDQTGGLRRGAGLAAKPTASSDRGDTSQTLTVRTDAEVQRWATTLTANRTITLSTTGAVNGDRFRIIRTGAGGFSLAVGSVATLYIPGWVEVVYDGSAWVLAGSS